MIKTYYKGDTIAFDLVGQGFTLDDLDFKVLLYVDINNPITVNKDECEKVDDNLYRVSLTPQKTKLMELGSYSLEVYLIANNNKVVYRSDFFRLADSASKKEVTT